MTETNYRQRIETLEKENSDLRARVMRIEGAQEVLGKRILEAINQDKKRNPDF